MQWTKSRPNYSVCKTYILSLIFFLHFTIYFTFNAEVKERKRLKLKFEGRIQFLSPGKIPNLWVHMYSLRLYIPHLNKLAILITRVLWGHIIWMRSQTININHFLDIKFKEKNIKIFSVKFIENMLVEWNWAFTLLCLS